ncbi:Syntaxin-binding protein 5 [Fasciolopsis buskii]|uniref:Syntaxin-binding protein 5 n=1 Tax=Fasciolopsis buskii TaxID=27845 RepID=A0A8E0VPA2_9TREM|nr:Syntaxin-binding protein 5 [Fasciolopsis buski]
MYLGTDKGNVHFVNVQRFVTSGYVINWNKAIDLSQSAHPGRVVQIAENPQDPNKLLIGYSSGFLTLWDLRTKAAEARFKYSDVSELQTVVVWFVLFCGTYQCVLGFATQ